MLPAADGSSSVTVTVTAFEPSGMPRALGSSTRVDPAAMGDPDRVSSARLATMGCTPTPAALAVR